MPETINIPRESTMQEISQSLQAMAFAQAGQDISSWDSVSRLVRNGFAKKIFNYGDQFVETWKDTAPETPAEYEYPWQVNHFEDVELEDGEIVPGMFLQAHWAHPFGVQFSNARAFLKCPDGLAAGTYNIKMGAAWGKTQADTYWQFTLTVDVPEGGRLAGFIQMPDITPTSLKVISYGADGIAQLETVAVSSGQGGTALGTLELSTRNGNLNSMQETGYGWNRWKTSALRQYLNSDKPKGQWWTAQDEWDIAPNQLAEKDGFLRGMPEEMLKHLKTVKVVTYTNTVQDGGEADITYDKVFLPSLEQIYVNPQISGEGVFHEYWKQRSGSKTKLAQYGTYPRMITYAVENHASPQLVRLRSAYRGLAYYTWNVNASGSVNSGYAAWYAHRFAPLVVL